MAERENSATVLVTGAGRRLGRAIALDLGRRGWQVGVHYHTAAEEAHGLVAELARKGGRAAAFAADLSHVEELASLVKTCAEELGPLTCLINNAACFEWDSAKDLDPERWQAHLDVNLRAPVFLTQAFAKQLPERTFG